MPAGFMFVGLVDGEWRLFLTQADGALRRVPTASEPRTPAYSAQLSRIAYIAADGALREIELQSGSDSVLLQPSTELAYTQPVYRPGGDELYVVALRDRSSVETDIGRVDRQVRRFVPVLHQRSAQFEPAFSPDGAHLLYSNVLCASECPKIIQEIWTMAMASGVAEQLTLVNAVARQPVADARGGVIFSSNRDGMYRLWRSGAPGDEPEQLTDEPAVDQSPAVTASGHVFFVRRTAHGGRLMRLDQPRRARTIELDPSIQDIRDLRWGQS